MNDQETATEKRVLPVVLFTVFLDMLGVGILLPVIPQLLGNPRSTEYLLDSTWTTKEGLVLLGFLVASYTFAQFLAAPILGQVSDHLGRRKVLAISLAGTAVGYGLFAIGILTKNVPLLFAARILDGITGGNISVAQAAIADVTPPEHRAKNFGLIGALFGVGFVMGPYLGGKLASPGIAVFGLTTPSWFGAETPFWFAGCLALLNTALVVIRFPETIRQRSTATIKWTQAVSNIRRALTIPGLTPVFLSMFFFYGGFAFFTTFFNLFLSDKLNFRPDNVGDFFAYIGLCIAFTQGLITPRLAKRFSSGSVVAVVLPLFSLAILVAFVPNNTTQLLLTGWVIPVCAGLLFSNVTALISQSASSAIQGEVLGIGASVQALANSVPAALSGFLGAIAISAPIWAASIAIGIGALIFLGGRRTVVQA